MRKIFLFCSCLLFLTHVGEGTVLSPWLRNLFEFEARESYGFMHVHTIQTPEGSFTYNENTHRFDSSLGFSPWPSWDLELELYFSHTPKIDFAYEAFLLTGRYQWLDDISGDPFSLVTGVTLAIPGNRFLRDFSYFYHGHINGEFHVSVGKECADLNSGLWKSRVWMLGGIGLADEGSPWIHGIISSERVLFFGWVGGIFGEGLFGLGNRDISPFESFDGYAKIDHRTIDVGAFISYPLCLLGSFTLQANYNVYAHNAPKNSFKVQAELLIPFSL